MNPKEIRLSAEQIEKLDRIAVENAVPASELVSLAVDALISEAGLHPGWLPIPSKISRAVLGAPSVR